jgi:hypothetical protein
MTVLKLKMHDEGGYQLLLYLLLTVCVTMPGSVIYLPAWMPAVMENY